MWKRSSLTVSPKSWRSMLGCRARHLSAVYQSSGLNMVQMLTDIFVRGRSPSRVPSKALVSTYEHLIFDHGLLYSIGEGSIIGKSGTGRLEIMKDWCGFDQVITDYQPNVQRWVATAMTTGRDHKAVQRKRMKALDQVMEKSGAREHVDSSSVKAFA